MHTFPSIPQIRVHVKRKADEVLQDQYRWRELANVVEAEVAAIENVGTAEWRLPDFQSLVRSVNDRVNDLA